MGRAPGIGTGLLSFDGLSPDNTAIHSGFQTMERLDFLGVYYFPIHDYHLYVGLAQGFVIPLLLYEVGEPCKYTSF